MIKISLPILLCGSVLMAGSAQAGNAEAGKAKSEDCAECHGDNGKGDPDNPAISSMSIEKFTLAMKEYQSGVRTKSKKMTKQANRLSDEDISDLAAYYATLK
jgi:cytochrome c553